MSLGIICRINGEGPVMPHLQRENFLGAYASPGREGRSSESEEERPVVQKGKRDNFDAHVGPSSHKAERGRGCTRSTEKQM